jgi:uncharacterized protein YybS (DUF2232 family)
MNKSKQLTDGALLSAIFIVLMLITAYVPVLSLLSLLILAVPFIIFAAKYSWKPSLIMLVATSILTMIFATFLAIPLPILAGLGGIMIGSAIHQNSTPYETWARGTLGFVMGMLFTFLFSYFILQINIIGEFDQQVDQVLEMSKQMMVDLGMEQEAEEEFILLEQQVNVFKNLVPVGIVLISLLFALLNQWISYKILNRIEGKQLRFPKFRNLRFPTAVIWIYFLAILVSFFQTESNGTIVIALQNILMLVGLLMVIQGFSLIFFYAHNKHLSKAIPVIAIVLTVFFAPLLLPLVRILGIIDIGFGLRDRITKS